MTKWQHFLHALGLHDWHTIRHFEQEVLRDKCGPHDPRTLTRDVTMTVRVCCQCGIEVTRPWSLDWN